MNLAIGIAVFLVVLGALVGGWFLYRKFGTKVEAKVGEALDKAEEVRDSIKDKIDDIKN